MNNHLIKKTRYHWKYPSTTCKCGKFTEIDPQNLNNSTVRINEPWLLVFYIWLLFFKEKRNKKLSVLLFCWMRMIHLLQNLHAFLYKWFPIYRNNHVLLQYLSPMLLCQLENTHCKPWQTRCHHNEDVVNCL